MTQPKIDGVYVDGIYVMFFYGKDLSDLAVFNFVNGIKLDNLKNSVALIDKKSNGISYEEFGLLFVKNRLIYVSGSEEIMSSNRLKTDEYILGGRESVFRPERDPAIISAQFLSYIDAMVDYNPIVNSGMKGQVCTKDPDCTGGTFSGNLNPEDWVVKAK